MGFDRADDHGDGREVRPPQRDQAPGGADRAGADRGRETRSREEYYQELRVNPDAQQRASGWDGVDAADRPAVEDIRMTPERRTHILDGDPGKNSGGHRHGTGRPGKTEFPADWDDEKVSRVLVDVARWPDEAPERQERNGNWVAQGTRDDVKVVAIVAGDGRIWTGWPLPGGRGVVQNPREK